jgi:hypothetical protein
MITQAQAHSQTKKSLGIATNISVSVCSRLEKVKADLEEAGLTPYPRKDKVRTTGFYSCRYWNFKQSIAYLHEERTLYNSRLHSRNANISFKEEKAA